MATHGWLLGLLVILIWGLWGFAGKIAINKLGAQVMLWSSALSALVFVIYLAWGGQLWPLRTESGGILWGIIVGLTAGLGTLLYFLFLKSHPASLVVPLTALYPAVTVILGLLSLREQLTLSQGIGVLLALIAGVLLSR